MLKSSQIFRGTLPSRYFGPVDTSPIPSVSDAHVTDHFFHTFFSTGPVYMGADTGGGGREDASPQLESRRGTSPQKLRLFQKIKELTKNLFFQDFQNKVNEIRGEIGIWG